eukprot:scaffold16324_cov140-Isochrysis_galbana.AAC.3
MAPRQLLLELEEVDMWPRKKARSESALTAQMMAQCRYDCPPERPPVSPSWQCLAHCLHCLTTNQSSGFWHG